MTAHLEAAKLAADSGVFERGSLPGWGLLILLILTIAARFTPIWKKLSMTENDKLIAVLQADGTALREELRQVREQGAQDRAHCRAENDALHEAMRNLSDEVHGLRRQLVLQQADRIVMLAGAPTEGALHAAAMAGEMARRDEGKSA